MVTFEVQKKRLKMKPQVRAIFFSVIGFCLIEIFSISGRLENQPNFQNDVMAALPFIGHDLIKPTTSKTSGSFVSQNDSTSSVNNGKHPFTGKEEYLSFIPNEVDDSASSPNSGKSMRVSPVCQPSFEKHGPTRIKRIYLGHMRKAGGTTLRDYLEDVTEKYKLEHDAHEGMPLEYPGTRNDTLYVTHLRDPVSRIISHYKYSGRWDCDQLVDNSTSFKATKWNAVGLEDWVEKYKCQMAAPGTIWECSTNCYINWLNLEPNQKLCIPDDNDVESERFQMALTKAYAYNIIIDMDRLAKDATYISKLEHFFGLKGLAGPHPQPWCGEESKEANKKSPMGKIKKATLEDLYDRNSADYKLYDELINCNNHGIQFLSGSLTDFLG